MCFIGKNVPLLAEEDIPVLKIGLLSNSNGVIFSYFQHFEYEIGKMYHVEITKEPYNSDECGILNGLHSYNMDIGILICDSNFVGVVYNDKPIEIYSVYGKMYELCKMECIIPKGSTYYKNDIGEIVSDSLIINKTTKFKTNQL